MLLTDYKEKVAGVNITGNATGAGIKWGMYSCTASLTGDNQPLYIDGMPMGKRH
jgi:hypothetical protein